MYYNYSDQAISLFYTYPICLFPNIYFIISVHRRIKNEVYFMCKLEIGFNKMI